jgi:nucleoid-associated protein YgaU
LAVGGVLLAVLVVYVLIVPGNGNANQVGAKLEGADTEQTAGAAGIGDASGDTGATAARSGSAENDVTASRTNGGNDTQDQQPNAKAGGNAADTGASANTGPTGEAAGSAGANTGATTNDRQRGETAGGGWNWDALVNGTEKLPSLGAATDVPANNNLLTTPGGTSDSPTLIARGPSSDANTIAGNATSTNPPANATAADANTAAGNANAGNTNANAGHVNASDSSPRDLTSITNGTTEAPTTGVRQTPANGQTPAAVASATPGKHVVKAGDTYSKISLAVYGTSKHYADIEHANPGIDPTRLKPGMTINLPTIEARPAAARIAPQQEQALDPRTQYKVQPNDSLYTISLRLYGKADRVDKIYELNKAAIGDDMARVKAGMVLKLPEPPTQSSVATTGR